MVLQLLTLGADVNAGDCLSSAVAIGDIVMVQWLLDRQHSIRDLWDQKYPVCNLDILRLLVQNVIMDTTIPAPKFIYLCLQNDYKAGDIQIVRDIISAGVQSALNAYYLNDLYHAVNHGKATLAKVLIQKINTLPQNQPGGVGVTHVFSFERYR